MTIGKIGLGIVTCDRPDFYTKCVESINDTHKDIIDEIVVVNDSKRRVTIPALECHVINNKKNLGVGKSKNKLLKYLMDKKCEHIFLVEDDIIFNSNQVVKQYIELSQRSGVKHLNFCLHGEDNKLNGVPQPKLIVDYGDIKMSLYHNVYGALSYYHNSVIKDIGLMDKRYFNAMEHVDHTMETIKAGYHPPFRWFADIHNSDVLLSEQDHGHSDSKIRSESDWMKNFQTAVALFYDKHNINVCDPNQETASKDDAVNFLKCIKP